MAAVLYLDRICWAQAAPKIQADFHLTNQQMAYLAMAFQLAYGLFEIPTGRWGEISGQRRVLTRITLWWSAFTAPQRGRYKFHRSSPHPLSLRCGRSWCLP